MASSASADKQRLKELLAQRDALESEAAAISSRLTAPGQPGIQGSLIDSEGYPRADIDVAAVRGDRHRLACLNTDHRALSTQIEGLLLQVHAAARAEQTAAGPAPPLAPATPALPDGPAPAAPPAASGTPEPEPAQQAGPSHMDVDTAALVELPRAAPSACLFQGLIVFAVVDEVSEGSPAAAAGIQVGDRVCSFGDIRAGPQGGELQRIAQVLGSCEGQSVAMTLLRQGQPLSLTLVPQRWSGRGLLGCHLQPLKP